MSDILVPEPQPRRTAKTVRTRGESESQKGNRIRSVLLAVLLTLETVLTVPVFVVSWLVCAIGFAAKAGYLTAGEKNERAKIRVLNGMLGEKKKDADK